MIKLFEKRTDALVGTITEAQLAFMIEQLEEEDLEDQDYYINQATLDMFADAGVDPALLTLLKQILGDREDVDLYWQRE